MRTIKLQWHRTHHHSNIQLHHQVSSLEKKGGFGRNSTSTINKKGNPGTDAHLFHHNRQRWCYAAAVKEETRSITSGSSKRRSSWHREIGNLRTTATVRAWEGESGLRAKITRGNRRLRWRIYRLTVMMKHAKLAMAAAAAAHWTINLAAAINEAGRWFISHCCHHYRSRVDGCALLLSPPLCSPRNFIYLLSATRNIPSFWLILMRDDTWGPCLHRYVCRW